jgi:hypothetical protein
MGPVAAVFLNSDIRLNYDYDYEHEHEHEHEHEFLIRCSLLPAIVP